MFPKKKKGKHRRLDDQFLEESNFSKNSIRTLMRIEGKFSHGTRGKPGRSPHGDKNY
jgi:hypothetical protein